MLAGVTTVWSRMRSRQLSKSASLPAQKKSKRELGVRGQDKRDVTNFRGAQQSRFNLVPDTSLTSNLSSIGKREIETNRTSRGKPAPFDRVDYRVSGFSFGTAKWAK